MLPQNAPCDNGTGTGTGKVIGDCRTYEKVMPAGNTREQTNDINYQDFTRDKTVASNI